MSSAQAEQPPSGGVRRASAFLASGTIVSRVLGFASAFVLAHTIGTVNTASNAFTIANQLPNNIYAIIAGGLLSAILVPQIVRAGRDADGGQKFINRVVTLGIVTFLVIALIGTALAGPLVHLYAAQQSGTSASGFSQQDFELATAFAYWCLPQIFFYALYSLIGEVLNSRRIFGPFTWAPVVNNIVAIAGLLAFDAIFSSIKVGDPANWTPGMIALLAGSASLGVAAQAVFLIVFWRRTGLHYRPEFRWRGVGLGKVGKAAFWTFAMILITQVAGVVQSAVATKAGPDNPANTVLRYAWLIFMLPHGIITISIATPYFTRMSGHASRGDHAALRADLGASLRVIGLLLAFASVALIVVAGPFSALFSQNLHQTHAMSLAQTHAMAAVVIAYLVGLLPFSIVFVLQRVFYALEDTRTPFLFQTFQSILLVVGMLVSATLARPDIAFGIAVSTTIADFALMAVAAILLRRRLQRLGTGRILRSYLRFLAALAPAAAAGIGLDAALGAFSDGFALSGPVPAIVSIAVVGLGMAFVYAGGLLVVRAPEVNDLARPLLRRLHLSR